MTSGRRNHEPSVEKLKAQPAGASGGGDLGEAPLFEADIAELITLTADTRDQPIVEKVQVATVEALMDLARERSSKGRPREVAAVINGLPIARFMGRWMWDTRRELA